MFWFLRILSGLSHVYPWERLVRWETTAYVNSLEVLQPVSSIFMSTQTSVGFTMQCSSVNSPANQDEARLFQLSISALATLQVGSPSCCKQKLDSSCMVKIPLAET
jgi:hypothetical protein